MSLAHPLTATRSSRGGFALSVSFPQIVFHLTIYFADSLSTLSLTLTPNLPIFLSILHLAGISLFQNPTNLYLGFALAQFILSICIIFRFRFWFNWLWFADNGRNQGRSIRGRAYWLRGGRRQGSRLRRS